MNNSNDNQRRSILIIAGIILFSSGIIISLNYYSIKILSSIRAYVNKESHYSKAQKDATRYLIDYIQTSDIKSYEEFKHYLAVPIGDSLARVGMQQGADEEQIRRGLLQGRNHPDDLHNMIWLFRTFQHMPYFEKAIAKWTAADVDVGELDKIGAFIYGYKNRAIEPGVQAALKINVSTINRRLSNNQQAFSTILGEASRIISYWLLFINIFFILLILISAGLYARKAFKQLVESKALVIAQNQAKDEFLSIASHELKTPLTSMKASLQILERLAKNSPGQQQIHPFVVNANKHVNRLTDLVKDLLDVTKIHSGKLMLNMKQFQLNELIKEVVEEKNQVSQQKLVIEQLADGYVEADPNRIYQVFENFLSNAAKYSQESDAIHIYSLVEEGYIKVCVKDFGHGIGEDKIPLLFDRFYRIDETKHSVQGLGLGLFICKEIIKSHNGEIGADSEVGKGSTFWFRLPLVA
ncbi:sensor histidine kinase KdpD [Pedobacter sp. SYSU D00535]|uniref:sensor histidine kinase n=1 Tax=Pedobacter sp. SYSU D00535 TaxID=2810308 RepID=UPI001A95B985|nr:HAMP domain-containing sensor histidine kinase [Pedobacter sp. SYSU D00535]